MDAFRKPRVYVVTRKDGMDLREAMQFGSLRFVIQLENPSYPLDLFEFDATLNHLNNELCEFAEQDFLLPVGDLATCAAAAIIVARNTNGKVNMLRWDKRMKQYIVRSISDWGEQPETEPKMLAEYRGRKGGNR